MSNQMTQASRPKFSAMITTPTYQKMINSTIQDPNRRRRFVSAITSAVAVNPGLQECDPATILSSALLGESLNLSPSPQLGQYYMVPYDNKKKGCKDASFLLGYKGLIQLALRSGYYKRLNVIAIKEGELVSWNPVTEECELALIEDDTAREAAKTVGYLASFEYLNGFTKTIYWSRDKMIAHADRYSPAFSRNDTSGKYPKVSFADYEAHNYPEKDAWLYSSFWYKDFDGMAFKTMLRQLISKWGVMSIALQNAIEADTEDGSQEYLQADDAAPTVAAKDDGEVVAVVEETEAKDEGQVNLSDV